MESSKRGLTYINQGNHEALLHVDSITIKQCKQMCIGKWHGSVLRCRSEDFFSIKGVLGSRRRAAPEPPVELHGLKYHGGVGVSVCCVESLF